MRAVRVAVVVTLLAAALTALARGSAPAAPADPAAPAAAAPSPWRVTATLGLGLDHVATSCPTVAVCAAAAGGELLTTADGGTTWTRSTPALPTGLAELLDVACPSTSVCVLLARRTDATTAALTGPPAGPFTAATAPDAGTAAAVACPGVSHCLVTDGETVWTTRDRGATWRPSSLPRIAHSDPRITCVVATDRCVVHGNSGLTPVVDVTTDDGRHWTQRDPGAFDGLYALDCPTASVCVAGGRGGGISMIRRTTDGGATWRSVSVPGQPYGVRSVSCANATSCTAFGLTPGDVPYAWSTTDGTTWTAQSLTAVETSPSPQVDCPAAGRCRAVGGGIAYVTDDGGGSWGDRSLPAVPEEPIGISCSRATTCLAVGVDTVGRPVALGTTDAGATWTPHALPPTVGTPTSVSCVANTRTCTLVGAYAPPGNGRDLLRYATTSDLGVTWTTGGPGGTPGYLWSVSCPTTTTCLAGGYDARSAGTLRLTTDGARTWSVLTPPPGLSQDNWVSCPGPTTCVVESSPANAAPVVFVTHDLGASWRTHPLPGDPDHATFYSAVSCAGSTCVAVGSTSGDEVLARSADGGATWQRATVPFVQGSLGTVSCASALVCASPGAVFNAGGGPVAITTRDGGATWTVHRVIGNGTATGYRIACAGARCYTPTRSPFGNPVIVSGLA